MKKVHVVNHTHWDREWYFTTMDAILLSDNTFSSVIDELLNNKKAKFCLDGQSSILDDFIARRPDQLDNVKSLSRINNYLLVRGIPKQMHFLLMKNLLYAI
ncbi:hypothetical protein IGK11_001163 [Enterococcus sp. AZ146]